MSFPRTLALSEMQTALSRIWTQVVNSISYNDNHYVRHAFKNFAVFWYILVYSMYITWPKQFKPWKVLTVVGSIVVVNALKHSALLHSMRDLKTEILNMQHRWIWKLILYKFKLGYNTTAATKNICCTNLYLEACLSITGVLLIRLQRLASSSSSQNLVITDDISRNFAWVARTAMIKQD